MTCTQKALLIYRAEQRRNVFMTCIQKALLIYRTEQRRNVFMTCTQYTNYKTKLLSYLIQSR